VSRLIDRLKLIFLGLFALGAAGVWAYHLLWVWPEQRCEGRGDWWDGKTRTCAKPIPLYVLTGRGRPGSHAPVATYPGATLPTAAPSTAPSPTKVAQSPK